MTRKQNKSVEPQLQAQDPILSFLSHTVRTVKKHRRAFVTAAAILVLAGLVGGLYTRHIHQVSERSWAAYYNAQMAVISNPTDPAVLSQLDGVALQFPHTTAAQYAQLFKGDILFETEHFAQAAEAYQPLVNSHNAMVRTVAALSLGAARQAAQDYEGSISVLTDFISRNSKSFALPQAYFTLAGSYELAGRKQEAKETYQQISADYANNYFGKSAKNRLTVLNK